MCSCIKQVLGFQFLFVTEQNGTPGRRCHKKTSCSCKYSGEETPRGAKVLQQTSRGKEQSLVL